MLSNVEMQYVDMHISAPLIRTSMVKYHVTYNACDASFILVVMWNIFNVHTVLLHVLKDVISIPHIL